MKRAEIKRVNRSLTREDALAFVVLFVLLVVSQLLAQEGTSALLWCLKYVNTWSVRWTPLISAAALTAVVLGGCWLGRLNPRPGTIVQTVVTLLAFLALVLSNAVPDWCAEAFGLDRFSISLRAGCFLLLASAWFAMCSLMLPHVRRWFETPIDLDAAGSLVVPDGPVTLIALVSKIDATKLRHDPTSPTASICKGNGGEATLTFQSLADDIENLQDPHWQWSWQQVFRAVARYAPRPGLKIVLIGSETISDDQRGSCEQLGTLAALLNRYPELKSMGTIVEAFSKPLDFENFNEVKEEVRLCIRDECRRVSEANVFVDITGGQKVASAAAAAATIGANGRFQYVKTNSPWDFVVSDLHPQTVPSAGN